MRYACIMHASAPSASENRDPACPPQALANVGYFRFGT